MNNPAALVPFPNSYWILPNLLLAGEYPADTDQEAAIKRLSALLSAGIRTFVDLTDEEEINEDAKPVPAYRGILRSLAEDERIDITYARIPIVDRGVPSVWTMRCVLDLIDRSLADENPAFVHCWAGRGRTGTVIGCYLMRHELATTADVISKIAELRRHMPSSHDSSPHTPEQIRMVRNWKKGS
jgi:Dual specificity phosphatase, catalytic domain